MPRKAQGQRQNQKNPPIDEARDEVNKRRFVDQSGQAAQDVPDAEHGQNIVDPAEMKNGALGTSAWLPLDRVVQKEELLERIGLGKVKLPHLPLEEKRYRITGGDAKQYVTEFGEMSIVKDIHAGPVPSHYLKRPSGTVNIIYSVPGFGLGGQGLDSFLVSDNAIFRPAKGARVFAQPTWFPRLRKRMCRPKSKRRVVPWSKLEMIWHTRVGSGAAIERRRSSILKRLCGN